MVGLLLGAAACLFLEKGDLFLAITQPRSTSRAAPRVAPIAMPAFAPPDKPGEGREVVRGVGTGVDVGACAEVLGCELSVDEDVDEVELAIVLAVVVFCTRKPGLLIVFEVSLGSTPLGVKRNIQYSVALSSSDGS